MDLLSDTSTNMRKIFVISCFYKMKPAETCIPKGGRINDSL